MERSFADFDERKRPDGCQSCYGDLEGEGL